MLDRVIGALALLSVGISFYLLHYLLQRVGATELPMFLFWAWVVVTGLIVLLSAGRSGRRGSTDGR